jgi:aspartate/methionine/tyrosine aminotransferase
LQPTFTDDVRSGIGVAIQKPVVLQRESPMPIQARLAKLLIRTGVVGLHPGVRKLMGDGLRVLRYYSSRVLEAPNEDLKRTQEAMDVGSSIDLCLGAPSLIPELREHLVSLIDESHGYPPVAGMFGLRQTFADKLRRENAMSVSPDKEMVVVNGVGQGLGLFLDAFVDPGESVALFDPCYFMYRLAAQHRRQKLRLVPTILEEGRARFDERLLAKALKGSRAILINSPNNPTGGVFSRDDLERIAYWCKRRDVLIFSDEVYEHFNYLDSQATMAAIPDAANRTISAFSFSKTYGMAAYRVGVVVGDQWLVRPMIVSMLASAPFVPTIVQRLAQSALSIPAAALIRRREEFRRRRDRATSILQRWGRTIDPPGGAFYCWIPIHDLGMSAHDLCIELKKRIGVAVMPGESLASNGEKFIRLSFAEEPGVWEEGFQRVARALSEWNARPSSKAA